MTVKNLQTWGYKKLKDVTPNPSLDTDLLLSHVLKEGLSPASAGWAQAGRSFLYAHPETEITKKQETIFKKLVGRREKREPMAYLLGEAEFCGLKFKVTPDVLIPRPETEMLVDEALKLLKVQSPKFKTLIDIGTGSGAIIISIVYSLLSLRGGANSATKQSRDRHAAARDDIQYIGLDISGKALKVVKHNARKILGKNHPIKFIKSDLLAKIIEVRPRLKPRLKHPVLFVANLPYLTKSELKRKELMYEPGAALYGGNGGLELIHKLILQFARIAESGDIMLLEIGAGQADKIKKLTQKYLSGCRLKIKKDFNGFDRVAIINI